MHPFSNVYDIEDSTLMAPDSVSILFFLTMFQCAFTMTLLLVFGEALMDLLDNDSVSLSLCYLNVPLYVVRCYDVSIFLASVMSQFPSTTMMS